MKGRRERVRGRRRAVFVAKRKGHGAWSTELRAERSGETDVLVGGRSAVFVLVMGGESAPFQGNFHVLIILKTSK